MGAAAPVLGAVGRVAAVLPQPDDALLKWIATRGRGFLVGETAVAKEAIAPGAIGRVELRGTAWTARNRGLETLATGTRCVVIGVDRLTLFVEAEGARA